MLVCVCAVELDTIEKRMRLPLEHARAECEFVHLRRLLHLCMTRSPIATQEIVVGVE